MYLPLTRNLDTITLPAADHPLYPMAIHCQVLIERAREAERLCERLAPTPMTMAGDDPADSLAGDQRDFYLREYHRCADLIFAAKSACHALDIVADSLGGW